uniref:PgsA, CDP-diacylglycerol-glycerol-3-phosphate 3-phosphatidyltransferase n=1 Tax=uncultured firmicutes bacterium contig_61 TaxID=1643555 RepID=A0A141GNI4_9FIRM|nr:pgsA, CDP-diacylglycerol-glycerol-3-phosphate 3-phosphatidyltransferase [uncultured firmicutes bacterium contig_61]
MKKYLTIPNVVTISRAVFLPFLYVFMYLGMPMFFLVSYIVLGSTDFFDGKLARWLRQVTPIGKVLDSICDLLFYLSSIWFFYYLFSDFLQPNMPLLWVLLSTLALSFVVSFIRIKKPMMMHTRILRLSAVLVYFLIISSFFFNTTYFVTVVIMAYIIGFLESILIFIKFGHVDPDTTSIFALLKRDNYYEENDTL